LSEACKTVRAAAVRSAPLTAGCEDVVRAVSFWSKANVLDWDSAKESSCWVMEESEAKVPTGFVN